MRGAPLLEQFLVHAVCPGGDRGPGEMFLDAPAAGVAHGVGRGTVAQDAVERVGQRPGVGRRHEQAQSDHQQASSQAEVSRAATASRAPGTSA